MMRQGETLLHSAFSLWAQCMYSERALDWEQNYLSQVIIRSFFTNFAKFHQRNDSRLLSLAFA
jgi:hypothetical protein